MAKFIEHFTGTFRQTYQGQDPKDAHIPLFFLETSGFDMEPLTFHTKDGKFWRPASQMDGYDEGSVPHGPAQAVVSPNAWGGAYAFHDPSYLNHGWWEWNGTNWEFQIKTRYEVDLMMYRGMRALGCGVIEANLAYGFVREFGGSVWNKHKGPFPVGLLQQGEFIPMDAEIREPLGVRIGNKLKHKM